MTMFQTLTPLTLLALIGCAADTGDKPSDTPDGTVNSAPIAQAATHTTQKNTPIEMMLEGMDADNDELTFEVVDLPIAATLSGEPPLLTFTPDQGFTGVDSYTFRVTDGLAESEPAIIEVEVEDVANQVPLANSLSLETNEDEFLSIIFEGEDADSDVLLFELTEWPTNGELLGALPFTGYVPTENQWGTDRIRFTVWDGHVTSDEATIDIVIHPVNDAPTCSSGMVTTLEDTPIELPMTSDDVDGDQTDVLMELDPVFGQFDHTNRVYTPMANYNGLDALAYRVTDGLLDSDLCTLDIEILPVNDPPERPVIVIEPTTPTIDDTLLCVIVEASVDPEGDLVSYEFGWTVDGVQFEDISTTVLQGDTVSASHTLSGQQWSCRVEAADPYESGGSDVVSVDLL